MSGYKLYWREVEESSQKDESAEVLRCRIAAAYEVKHIEAGQQRAKPYQRNRVLKYKCC